MSIDKNKQRYRQWCAAHADRVPLFFQDWWLDIVCGDRWEGMLAWDKGGNQVEGLFTYYLGKRWGLQGIDMPVLCPTMGPFLFYPASPQKLPQRYAYEHQLLHNFEAQLPDCWYFKQKWTYQLTSWLPFHWKGYRQSSYFTYLLSDISNPAGLFEAFSGATRTTIRKAGQLFSIRQSTDLPGFYALNKLAFPKGIPYSQSYLHNIYEGLAKRGQVLLLIAENHIGESVSGIFLALDDQEAFLLASGQKEEGKQGGATSLLIWEALCMLRERVQRFNFEGSMLPGVEHFYRGFGGALQSYHLIRRLWFWK